MNEKTKNKQSFIVQIHFCRYSTWQGTIQWLETGKKQNFRSALELIKLIDSADNSRLVEWQQGPANK